ncbi:pentapeptide repeat-containing protein [Natronorubrum sp. FCH18a]|uniref:pentapeptide repeat-containing protein n=1 Tax=Natronorubrum sp. FCH18a TaxID=3447018 RepID=UPI003F50E04B
MSGCTYFSSEEWRKRLLADTERIWDPRDVFEIADTDSISSREHSRETELLATLEAVGLSEDDLFAAWAAEHEIELRESCPHPEIADERCLFHLPVDHPQKTEADLAERVIELVREESAGDRAKYFVGAKFGALSLSYRRLESHDKQPIQLAHCSADRLDLTKSNVQNDVVAVGAKINTFEASHAAFQGVLAFTGTEFSSVTWPNVTCHARADFRHARFRDEITFEYARLKRRADFADAVFEDRVDFGRAVFEGAAVFTATAFETAVFSEARFDGIAEFDGTCFRGNGDFTGDESIKRASFEDAVFYKRADFADRVFRHAATFEAASFGGEGIFDRIRIEGQVTFNKAQIDGRAHFKEIVVDEQASLSDIDFGSNVSFSDAVFKGTVTFMWTQFPETASFENASFQQETDFTLAEFHRLTDFSDATFDAKTTFEATHFEAAIAFDRAVFHGSVTFENVRLAYASFDETEAAVPIPVVNAVVTAGTFVQPRDGATYYDFTDSTIANVTFQGPRNVFERVRFHRTTFDGFDFSHHTRALAVNEWRLHQWDGSATTDSPSALQDTYLKAKNGADDMGQNTAAAEFFLLEMYYKRQVHRELASDADRPLAARISSLLQYTYNLTFSITAGYGERPSRTALSSVATIGLFAGLFQSVAGPPLETALYLRISLQAFVALILGDVPTASSFQLLSALEAFIGAFFIALFVFTLTRSVNR